MYPNGGHFVRAAKGKAQFSGEFDLFRANFFFCGDLIEQFDHAFVVRIDPDEVDPEIDFDFRQQGVEIFHTFGRE